MGSSILVDPSRLEAAANNMDSQIAEYKREYNQLFSEVDSMGSAWQGSDNLAFVNQINGFREEFDAMSNLMSEYSSFLKAASNTYNQSQSDVVNGARKLTN